MKLVKFDATNSGGRKGKSAITFGKKGLISLSKQAVEALSLSAGDKVALLQDEEEADWYIGKDKDGFTCRLPEGKGGGAYFNASGLCSSVIESLDLSIEESHTFLLAPEPITHEKQKLFAILTGSRS